MLSKDEILGIRDIKVCQLDIPEWNGTVNIRVMTGAERDAFESATSQNGKPNLKDIRARFAALVLCDENGTRLFSDADVKALTEKSAAALDRIFDAGMAWNGMSSESVEVAEKN